MPSFFYTALDGQGSEKVGRLEATDAKQVTAMLRRQGLFPTGVTAAVGPAMGKAEQPAAGWHRQVSLPFLRVVGARDLAVFTRQLGTLIHAGMPLLRGLEVLGRQEKNLRFRRVIETLAGLISV